MKTVFILMRLNIGGPTAFPACKAFSSYPAAHREMKRDYWDEYARARVNIDDSYVVRRNALLAFVDGRRISWSIKELEVEDGDRDAEGG